MIVLMVSSEAELLSARLTRMRALLDSLERECEQSADAREKFEQLKREMATVDLQLQIIQHPKWSPQTERFECPNCLKMTGVLLRDFTIMTGKRSFACAGCAHRWSVDP